MADVNRDIAKSGGDHATWAAFLAATNVTSDRWIGTGIDDGLYDESLSFQANTGTPDATNHVVMLVATANEHDGDPLNTSCHRIHPDTTAGNALTIFDSHGHIRGFHFQLITPAASDEIARFDGATTITGVLLERNVIRTTSTAADTDGIYSRPTGTTTHTFTLLNNLIQGFTRGGVHAQTVNGDGSSISTTVNAEYNTIHGCGSTGELESGGIRFRTGDIDAAHVLNAFNNAVYNTTAGADFEHANINNGTRTDTRATYTGSNNATSDASQTDRKVDAADTITVGEESRTDTDDFVDPGNSDFSVKAGGALSGNGTPRTTGLPDARGDYTIDAARNTRSVTAPSIGWLEELVEADFPPELLTRQFDPTQLRM